MIERELTALADRVAPPTRPDLPDRVLARIDDIGHRCPAGTKGHCGPADGFRLEIDIAVLERQDPVFIRCERQQRVVVN